MIFVLIAASSGNSTSASQGGDEAGPGHHSEISADQRDEVRYSDQRRPVTGR